MSLSVIALRSPRRTCSHRRRTEVQAEDPAQACISQMLWRAVVQMILKCFLKKSSEFTFNNKSWGPWVVRGSPSPHWSASWAPCLLQCLVVRTSNCFKKKPKRAIVQMILSCFWKKSSKFTSSIKSCVPWVVPGSPSPHWSASWGPCSGVRPSF